MSAGKKQFLEHLAGLRGVAIIAVLLFHLNGKIWDQGYLGVDVFLVITGYLLFRSSVSARGVESVKEGLVFLWRRIGRIVPSMCVLIALAIGAGALLLSSGDETFACRVGYQACLAKVNVFLGKEASNYFASDSAFNPLLHLWYLAVTLQVYLVWAVGKQVLQRLPRWIICTVCALVAVGSYVWGQVGEVSYYDTLPRVWEVLAGGLVCLLPELTKRRVWASVLAGVGLATILASAFSCLPACPLAVVAGAVLVLRYMPAGHFAVLLSNAPLVWLGRISFSLYLVHMPLIVFCHLWYFNEVSVWGEALLVLSCVVVGWVYYVLVEKRRAAWWLVLPLWVGVLLLCRFGYKTEGFEKYIPLRAEPAVCAPYEQWHLCQEPSLGADWPRELTPYDGIFRYILRLKKRPADPEVALLAMGDPKHKPTIALLGDSHATHLYAGLDTVLRKTEYSGVYLMPIILPFEHWEIFRRAGYTYDAPREKALYAWLEAHPELKHIIIGQDWMWRCTLPKKVTDRQYEQALRGFIARLNEMGKKVILMGPSPKQGKGGTAEHYTRISALRGEWPKPNISSKEMQLKMNRRILPILQRLEKEGLCTVLDLIEVFNSEHTTPADYKKHRVHMVDANHLSPEGSVWMMERLLPQLLEALK